MAWSLTPVTATGWTRFRNPAADRSSKADYTITFENGESFTCNEDIISFDSPETQGIDWLSYCRSGACSL